jgi:predicted transcriptional regulator
MNKIAKLPEAELEIIMIVWDLGENATSEQIMNRLEGRKSWERTTVLNFLSRLVDRGFLRLEKRGKINLYTPIISKCEYLEHASKSFLEKMYNNSVKKLVATLYNSQSISKEDLKELKRFIEEAE